MEQRQLIVILADISGYTRFMLENQTAAVHGQLVITGLIETILAQVDIPLTLQEIEGDAVFLYAARSGTDAEWQAVVREVSLKLENFFEAFTARAATMMEVTPCGCAICRNSDKLGLKIIVHAGEAVFHAIAGRPQVSGADVILAHRLLKNTVPSREYLLVSERAYTLMSAHLPGTFSTHEETYEGFGKVNVHVRLLDQMQLAARETLYALTEPELEKAVSTYVEMGNTRDIGRATLKQLREPVRPFSWREKLSMLWGLVIAPFMAGTVKSGDLAKEMKARGKLRTEWAGK